MRTLAWLLILFLFLSDMAIGQKNAAYLKINHYLPLFGEQENLGISDISSFKLFTYSNLGLGYHRELDTGRYREWEVGRLLFHQEDNGTSFTETVAFSIGYGNGAVLRRRYNSIKVRLGGSLRYYYANRNIIIIDNIIQQTHGLILSFTGYLDWRVHKNWYVEMAPAVQLANASFRLEDNFQPTQTIEEATAVDYFFRPLRLALRFGLCYRLK